MSQSADILRTGQILAMPHILRDYSLTVFLNTRQTPFRPHLLPQKRNFIQIPLKQRYLLVLNNFFLHYLSALVIPHVMGPINSQKIQLGWRGWTLNHFVFESLL